MPSNQRNQIQLTTPKLNNFISFEGLDGCGKTTQIELLKNSIINSKLNILTLREPGGTNFGENLRNAILNSPVKLEPVAEAYLFASSRAQLMKEKIQPALEDETMVVISDRFIHSSFAYQGHARNLGNEFVLQTHSIEPLNIIPNITFFLDISAEESMKRQKSRSDSQDYFEQEKLSFFKELRKGYLSSSNYLSSKFIKIDATKSIELIHQEIIKALASLDKKYEATLQ